jgi:hypothetical protein
MASQEVLDNTLTANGTAGADDQGTDPGISLGGFQWTSVDNKFEQLEKHKRPDDLQSEPPPPLGPLEFFNGTFKGNGFNTVFRPRNSADTGPPTVSTPPTQTNVLLLNLTQETLAFAPPLGDVPNRGANSQPDQHLNGVPYTQTVDDITDPGSGMPNPKFASGIHFEPGVWLYVPASAVSPDITTPYFSRMGSIPHGVTINVQGLENFPQPVVAGPPDISPVDITPFVIGEPNQLKKQDSQTATSTNTSRLPQDLTKFIGKFHS